MEYKLERPLDLHEGKWNEKTCIRRQSGWNLAKENLGKLEFLPKGAVLALVDGEATLVKTAKVQANADKSATALQVEKQHALIVGDKIGGSTISAIDTTNAEYDLLTVTELGKALKKGDVIADDNVATIIGLNYATVKIDSFPSVTATVQAYEIEEETLPYFVNDAIKAALTARHDWKF